MTDRRPWLWGLLLVALLAALYTFTVQRDINGSNAEYVNDSGEFQVVLTTWGTAHPTGYPLYSLAGAAFTHALGLVGVPPALAASLFSAGLTLAALVGVYGLLLWLGVAPPVALLAALLLGVVEPVWAYGSVAEVYALLLALLVLAFVIGARWWTSRDPRWLVALAAALGFAVGHHRLAVLGVGALVIFVWPLALAALRERPARLFLALAAFLLPLLVYLYLPLRAVMHAPWVYGQPDTWDGFWAIVRAQEYAYLLKPAASPVGLVEGLTRALAGLARDLPWPLAVAGLLGLVGGVIWPRRAATAPPPALRDDGRRWLALALLALVGADVLFAALFSHAVFLPAALLPALLALTIGAGLLAQWLAERGRVLGGLAAVGLAAGVVVLVMRNGAAIRAVTADPAGRQLIERVAATGLTPPAPLLMTTWGNDFFVLNYGKATGALPPLQMVDHRADLRGLVEAGRPVYALASTFYTLPLAWWDDRLGRAHLSAAPGDLVRVANAPILSATDLPPTGAPVAMGPITLRAWQAEPLDGGQRWRLSLYWQATEPPRQDYSVFVHVSDKDAITGPDDLIAQADRAAPVYGWYPTSRWTPGEIVRDEYIIDVPDGKDARHIAVGLYTQDAGGAFRNLGRAEIPLR